MWLTDVKIQLQTPENNFLIVVILVVIIIIIIIAVAGYLIHLGRAHRALQCPHLQMLTTLNITEQNFNRLHTQARQLEI